MNEIGWPYTTQELIDFVCAGGLIATLQEKKNMEKLHGLIIKVVYC